MNALLSGDLPTLLLIGVDPAESKMLGTALSRFGCRIRTADSDDEALHSCEVGLPDIVIVNLSPSDIDRFFTIAKLRSTLGAEVPIVALAPCEDGVVRNQSLRVGANYCLTKQHDHDRLKEYIIDALFQPLENG